MPYLISSSFTVWPPTTTTPASAAFAIPPAGCRCRISTRRAPAAGSRRCSARCAARHPSRRRRKRVRRRDRAERVRVVDDGREEVDGLHEREIRRQTEHAGVVGGASCRPGDRGAPRRGQRSRISRQVRRTQLAGSTRGRASIREPDARVCGCDDPRPRRPGAARYAPRLVVGDRRDTVAVGSAPPELARSSPTRIVTPVRSKSSRATRSRTCGWRRSSRGTRPRRSRRPPARCARSRRRLVAAGATVDASQQQIRRTTRRPLARAPPAASSARPAVPERLRRAASQIGWRERRRASTRPATSATRARSGSATRHPVRRQVHEVARPRTSPVARHQAIDDPSGRHVAATGTEPAAQVLHLETREPPAPSRWCDGLARDHVPPSRQRPRVAAVDRAAGAVASATRDAVRQTAIASAARSSASPSGLRQRSRRPANARASRAAPASTAARTACRRSSVAQRRRTRGVAGAHGGERVHDLPPPSVRCAALARAGRSDRRAARRPASAERSAPTPLPAGRQPRRSAPGARRAPAPRPSPGGRARAAARQRPAARRAHLDPGVEAVGGRRGAPDRTITCPRRDVAALDPARG